MREHVSETQTETISLFCSDCWDLVSWYFCLFFTSNIFNVRKNSPCFSASLGNWFGPVKPYLPLNVFQHRAASLTCGMDFDIVLPYSDFLLASMHPLHTERNTCGTGWKRGLQRPLQVRSRIKYALGPSGPPCYWAVWLFVASAIL